MVAGVRRNQIIRQGLFMMKEFIIDGIRITTVKSFFKEIERELIVDRSSVKNWSLDVLDDIFEGGYGVYELNEEIRLIWMNFRRSEKMLDQKFLQEVLELFNERENITIEFN